MKKNAYILISTDIQLNKDEIFKYINESNRLVGYDKSDDKLEMKKYLIALNDLKYKYILTTDQDKVHFLLRNYFFRFNSICPCRVNFNDINDFTYEDVTDDCDLINLLT